MLQIYVDSATTRVAGLSEKLTEELRFALSYSIPGYVFTRAYAHGWDGRKSFLHKGGRFLTGLLPRACQYLDSIEEPYRIVEDLRPEYPEEEFCPAFPLRSFQPDVLEQVQRYRRGIVSAPPRSGKTILAVELFRRTSLSPFLYIVWQAEVAHQAANKFRKLLPGAKVGVIADGKADLDGDILVVTFQSLASAFGLKVKRKDCPKGMKKERILPLLRHAPVQRICRDSKVVVWDEAHHTSSDIAQLLAQEFHKAAYVVGLTATPWREDASDIGIEAVTGPILYHMSYEEAVERGIILPLDVTVFQLPAEDLDTRGGYQQVYKTALVDNDRYHRTVAHIVEYLRRRGKTVAVIVGHVPHGQQLERAIPRSLFVSGKSSPGERRAGLRHIEEQDGVCLISTLIDEAVDLPTLDAIVVADVKKSAIKAFQRLRSMTVSEGKKRATAVFFQPDVVHLKNHAERTVKFLRSEQPPFRVFRRRIYGSGQIGPAERLRPTKRSRRTRRLTVLPGATAEERKAVQETANPAG